VVVTAVMDSTVEARDGMAALSRCVGGCQQLRKKRDDFHKQPSAVQ
jgi:hypothetical protein